MNWPLLSKLLGMLCLLVGGSMAMSLPWAFPELGVAGEFETKGFQGILGAMSVSLAVGGLLSWLGRGSHGTILHKEALAIVGLGWILAGILGALPFLFSGTMRAPETPMTVIDAIFESVSGFTTTGASVLTDLENPDMIPKSVMFWRCFTHWLGGMGIIVLFVALLGHLGGGGKALMQKEVPGPLNETVKPRVREAALVMWKIYVGLSVVLAILFFLLGMSPYDSLCHTFGTLATGGFSTYNKSIGHFDSISIELTITLFMLIAGTNFSLYYIMMSRRPALRKERWRQRLGILFKDPEWKVYIGVLLLATIVLTGNLLFNGVYNSVAEAVRHASFISIAIMTTTGFGTEDFSQWGEFAKGLLLLMMFVGGCAGSTGGGMKVVRFILFFKIMKMEVEHAFRPKVIRSLRIGDDNLPDSLRHDVVVYFSLILFIFISSWMTLNVIEPDTQWKVSQNHTEAEKLLDCASAVAATLNNIGPGLGVLGPASNFSEFSQQGKMLLTLLMLLGRLELFAVLVLFFPSFWRYQ